MTDYTELVKELLRVGTCAPGYEPLLSKAADAIEELAAFQKQLKDGRMYIMRDGVLYEANIELPKANKIVLPPLEIPTPPKEDEA